MKLPSHLRFLEAEAIHIFREVAATTSRPVMLYSVGKDSSVLTRLAFKAFHPMRPPFPFLHVDTTWKFRELIEFRDRAAAELQFDLVVHINQEGLQEQINPFIHGASHHIHVWKTIGLKQAIRQHKFDAALGGARRDEEKSRAKERIFSIRNSEQNWDPKNQRPELWKTYNTLLMPDESLRVFPLSNWTELDVWQYIQFENIPVVPLYFAAKRLVVEINGFLILVDDERMPLELRCKAEERIVRFRSLGCYPLTGAISSHAQTVEEIIRELRDTRSSERHVRTMDFDKADTLERKKREGYF